MSRHNSDGHLPPTKLGIRKHGRGRETKEDQLRDQIRNMIWYICNRHNYNLIIKVKNLAYLKQIRKYISEVISLNKGVTNAKTEIKSLHQTHPSRNLKLLLMMAKGEVEARSHSWGITVIKTLLDFHLILKKKNKKLHLTLITWNAKINQHFTVT